MFRDFERVLLAFISACIDYCYILYVGSSQASLSHLQFVRDVAPRLLTGACKSTFLLYWRLHGGCLFILGFSSRFYCLLNRIKAPPTSRTPSWPLRSAERALFNVPQARLKVTGDTAFVVVAPKLWYELPVLFAIPRPECCQLYFWYFIILLLVLFSIYYLYCFSLTLILCPPRGLCYLLFIF